ncbi:MAG: ABC transporter permease [Gammaproteobacteria bacterium]|nr:ABC transporter permease [Gammaproteobacteria bacterium]
MSGFVLWRLAMLVPVLLGITVVVFVLMAIIPGDTALAILGPYATPERVARIERELGLDRSVVEQYVLWVGRLVQGDLGWSYSLNQPVREAVASRMGPTLLLAACALFIGTLLGLLAGTLAAVHQNRWPDRTLTLSALIGISTPAFWLAMLLMMLFAVWLGLFPVSGMRGAYGGDAAGILDVAHHLVLPSVSLGLVAAGVIARLQRTAMFESLGDEHIRMARAKGLPESRVLYSHAFKSALARVVPVVGLQAGYVLGGAIYIETVFQWPGVGRLLVDAISTRDILLVQGAVVVVASAYVLVNLCADVFQRMLDPRIET